MGYDSLMNFQVPICDLLWKKTLTTVNTYIWLDVLVSSIAVYFYESCSILASPKSESKYKWWVNVFVSPKFWLAKVFYLSRGRGNETSTNIVWSLYSFRALFVLYEAELQNNDFYYTTTLRGVQITPKTSTNITIY